MTHLFMTLILLCSSDEVNSLPSINRKWLGSNQLKGIVTVPSFWKDPISGIFYIKCAYTPSTFKYWVFYGIGLVAATFWSSAAWTYRPFPKKTLKKHLCCPDKNYDYCYKSIIPWVILIIVILMKTSSLV